MKALSPTILLFVLAPCHLLAQSNTHSESSIFDRALLYPGCTFQTEFLYMQVESSPIQAEDLTKAERCLRTGRIIGALAGSAMGINVLILGARGEMDCPYWKTMALAIPGVLIGARVGSRGAERLAQKVLDARQGIGGSALRGAGRGLLAGAVTGAAAMVPILGLGKLLGAIEFNEDYNLIETVGLAAVGGAMYGSVYGTTIGLVFGSGISIYMEF